MIRAWLPCAALLWLSLSASSARAAVERFAVIAGNNAGGAADPTLQFAEADADKVANVLRDVGDFPPANVVVLRGSDAGTLRSTLIAVNERVRSAQSQPGTQVLLFVYYSGHADARALHLGSSELPLLELGQLVRGSAATFRMLVLDACRSGELTRRKGGTVAAPFDLDPEPGLSGEGVAFLTASAANEDAQESDELRGSFFTHALVSGLLGAADGDGDGQVVLEEAYRHAYAATLRSTSRTFAGAQHPTFQYDLRGQAAVVLTRTEQPSLGVLHFPPGLGSLVVAGNPEGLVVGEVEPSGSGRSLALRPGRYFVRARGRDELFEGYVELGTGESRDVDVTGFQRVAYAQLVRKGARASGHAQAFELGLSARGALASVADPCLGPLLGYRIEWRELSLYARLWGCRSGFENPGLEATTTEVALTAYGARAFDLGGISLALGLGAGLDTMLQGFETRGSAPSRSALVPVLGLLGNVSFGFADRFVAELDLHGETYFVSLQHAGESEASLRPVVSARGTALLGVLF